MILPKSAEYKARPYALRACARAVSALLHPLFVPVYVTCFLLFVHPFLFAGYEQMAKIKLAVTVFVNLCFFPALTVFLCWRLKFIGSMFLTTQKDRIIPLAAAMIFYFWCWFVLRNFVEIPLLLRQFLLGSFITVIVAWMANIYFKISLHALAMGGLLCFIGLVSFNSTGGSGVYLSAAALTAGVVCSARMIMDAHRPFDIYSGFMLGALSQLLAMWVS